MGGMPLVPTTNMADEHIFSLGKPLARRPRDLLKTTSARKFSSCV